MFSDEAPVRGSEAELLLASAESNQFLAEPIQASIPAYQTRSASSPSPRVTTANGTTAPIHKVSRGASSLPEKGPGAAADSNCSNNTTGGLDGEGCLAKPTLASQSPVRITGVATIILPPHQTNASLAPISSPTWCSTASSSPKHSHTVSSSSSSPVSAASSACSADHPRNVTNSTNHVEQSNPCPSLKQLSPSRPTVIDLNLFNTGSTDENNNSISVTKNSIDPTHIATALTTISSSSYKDTSSPVKNYTRSISINNINTSSASFNNCVNREEFDRFASGPLNSLEDFLNTQLPFDVEKEIQKSSAQPSLARVHVTNDVFVDANATINKYNNLCKGGNRNEILTVLKSEPKSAVYNQLPSTVLPPFSSVFNEPSPLSYPNSIFHCTNGIHYHDHHLKSEIEDDAMTTGASFPSTDNTLLHMNPVFGLSRTDSGFYSTGVHGSRNNSSSSCSSSSSTSSMDVDYEEAWGADMVEERNYTDLTSVRSICQGPELLTSIMNEDDEGSLHVLLSDSGAMKAEPLDDYPGFSMADFINNLDTSELDSDGYSSSTDNETPHYTQLEEPSSFNFFGSSPTMGAFPPLPVTPSDQAKLPITSTLPNSLAHSSMDGYPDHSDQWIVAKENLPDFRKLQDPSAEEKEKPTPSRRRSVPSSPKEKKKTGRESESPTLSEKSLSDRKKPGRKKGQVSNVLHLWEFMRDLLKDPSRRGDIIEWISEKDGVFRVVNSAEVARLWGEKKKNKKEMTYEKMSRSLRYSRLEGYFSDLPKDKNYPKKLCFKFGPKSKDWF